MTGLEACEDIVKYAEELSKHSHDNLYCRMQMWAKVIRKELSGTQPASTNSAMLSALQISAIVEELMICIRDYFAYPWNPDNHRDLHDKMCSVILQKLQQ